MSMKKVLETAMILMGTLGFWGFVYPEFCLTEETCRVESAEEREMWEEDPDVEVKLLGTDAEQAENRIVIRSKLAEYLFSLKESGATNKE